MTAEFPTLAQTLALHALYDWGCSCGAETNDANHAEHQAAMWHRACRIETAEQLNANWQTGTTIQEEPTTDLDFYPAKWEMAYQCGWTRVGTRYDPDDDTPKLPALLLWSPEWEPR